MSLKEHQVTMKPKPMTDDQIKEAAIEHHRQVLIGEGQARPEIDADAVHVYRTPRQPGQPECGIAAVNFGRDDRADYSFERLPGSMDLSFEPIVQPNPLAVARPMQAGQSYSITLPAETPVVWMPAEADGTQRIAPPLNAEEAAKLLRLEGTPTQKRRSLAYIRDSKGLRGIRTGRDYRYPLENVVAWIKNGGK